MNFFSSLLLFASILFLPFISAMLEIDLRNQTNEFVEWMEKHAFNMDENDEETKKIYFKFVNFTQFSNIKCIETKNE